MKTVRALIGLLVLAAAAACSVLKAPTPTATFEPSPTSPPAPTAQPIPVSTATPAPPPTDTPFAPFDVTISLNGVNLRTNPGYLFAVKNSLNADTTVKVLGKTRGGEWLQVQTQDGTEGWLFAQLVTTDVDLSLAPLVEPTDVQLITGKVQDQSGNPISGLQFSIVQTSSSTEQENDAMTDSSGQFYCYLPSRSSGMWAVIYSAIACSSNRMDQDCNCVGGVCGTVDPAAINVVLPQSEDVLFTWK